MTEVQELHEESRQLNRMTDRCMRCGAEAFIISVHSDLGELLFCGHHGRGHTAALEDQGWVVLDFLDQINAQPSSSANV